MIPNVSQALIWLKNYPQILKGIRRGIERETLRVNIDGSLATTNHPKKLGSVLTHKWITTDFAEALLEFITPVDEDIDHMLTVLRDIHRYTARILDNERMWPLSMPCCIKQDQEIKLAQYGTSNIGRLKTLYREGLKNRYGSLMQTISGIHYNFSFPMSFWKAKYKKINKDIISTGYFCLIRNYYRFGWVIPYLFGASPAVYSSFLQGKSTTLSFQKTNHDICYLPYATSLRLSDLGYINKLQDSLNITFNELHEYVKSVKMAIMTPSSKYEKIGIEKEGKRLQISSNILQIEDELYVPIRPKRVTHNGEASLDALLRDGIEYIEIRSLDVNPFSPIGISEQQVRFLDLFIIWCAITEAPKMNSEELLCTLINWNRVLFEGRKPDLTLSDFKGKNIQYPLYKIGEILFHDLMHLAQILDSVYGGEAYQQVCDELSKYFNNSNLTLSARVLQIMINNSVDDTGISLAEKYHNTLQCEPLMALSEDDFITECNESIIRQLKIEANDNESFITFLSRQY